MKSIEEEDNFENSFVFEYIEVGSCTFYQKTYPIHSTKLYEYY
jgi:hypothetical protein